MLDNPRSDRIRSLSRLSQRKVRAEQRLFLVEGAQAVAEALDAVNRGEAVISELFLSDPGSGASAKRADALETAARDVGVVTHYASDEVLQALSHTVTPQGAIAVCEFLDGSLDEVVRQRPRLVAFAAQIRDPGNAGSLIRVADAAGADAVTFSEGSVDPYNGKVVRSSVGSLFHLPIATDVGVEALETFRASGMQVLAADAAGDVDLDTLHDDGQLATPTVWVFGNEAWGLPTEWQQAVDCVVSIPIYGRAESLNLATAATLCLYASARAMGHRDH